MPVVKLDELHDLAVRVMTASKTSATAAKSIADALVAAEGDGLASHGASRIPFYADQAISGKVDGFVTPVVHEVAPAAIRVNAKDGFAYPAIDAGFAHVERMAPFTGIVAMAVSNSHHFGAAGYHLERMANKGFAGFAFGNTPAAMAPWGGNKATFGTNPLAFAVPRKSEPPLVIDMSLSVVARGKIMVAARKGEPIGEGWATDADGNPTTNADEALKGTLLPAGGAKGAVLAMMVEIIAATLTGSNYAYEATSFFDAEGKPPRVGQFFIFLKPELFGGDGYQDRLEELLTYILDQPGTQLPGYVPVREKTQKNGVEIIDSVYEDLINRAKAS